MSVIAFDAATNFTRVNPGTSLTFAHTCTGANGMLFVGVVADSDLVTGATYNAVAMVLVAKHTYTGTAKQYLFMLGAPTSGSNNVVVTASGSTQILGGAVSYTGAQYVQVADASGTANVGAGATAINKSITTIANNCWLVAVFRNDAGDALSAGAATTLRGSTAFGCRMGDSNAAITPPGSAGLQATWASSITAGMVIASFAPSSGPGRMFAVF